MSAEIPYISNVSKIDSHLSSIVGKGLMTVNLISARDLMSSPVRTVGTDATIEQARQIILRYGHSGLCAIDAENQLVGIISRRVIDLALHHGDASALVKDYMTKNLKAIAPDTQLPEIESLMVTYNIGRLPVLENGLLVGIVTRTDVLRQRNQQKNEKFHTSLRDRLTPALWEFLSKASLAAEQQGWHLYLVGGAVRDLLLSNPDEALLLEDIDLVVDGFYQSANVGAGVKLAKALRKIYPEADLEVHGQFQTAALVWHEDRGSGLSGHNPDIQGGANNDNPTPRSLLVDIATARTEFYLYPAANPEVEASSIRLDLYRRDFTINALAVRLTPQSAGELLDLFGGLEDLRSRQIRVLHANSFIEDPTRIYRAVRFAVRLGFEIEPETERFIRYAVNSGIYERSLAEHSKAPALTTRLRSELKYILRSPYWKPALKLLASLGALRCLHPTLELDDRLWKQVLWSDRCLRLFDPQNSLERWLVRLEVLIAHLAWEYRDKVATNLQLPSSSIERLRQLSQAQANVVELLPSTERPSQVVQLLGRYDLPTLILIAVQSPRSVRRQIWRYITSYARVQPPLSGDDLKALGYKQGREFKQMLKELLAATLDGVVSDAGEAVAFLARHYPQS